MVTLHSDFKVSHNGQPQITFIAMTIPTFFDFYDIYFPAASTRAS